MFGNTFRAGAEQAAGGGPDVSFPFDATEQNLVQSARAVADRVAQELDPRIIVIGAAPEGVDAVLKALRRRGVRAMVFAAGGSASDGFAKGLLAQPEEHDMPGFFTDNFFVASSIIFDSAGSDAQNFALRYRRAYDSVPSYVGAQATDGMRVVIEAMRRAHPRGTDANRAADREGVRDALAGMTSPARGVSGLDAKLFFDSGRNMALPLRIGFFRSGRLLSSPLQLVAVDHPELVGLSDALARHDIVQIADQYYWLQRLVYTGVDINRVSRVDVREGRFSVDFYLWMRFLGDAGAPTGIELPDALSPGLFNPATPIEIGKQDDLNYRPYRVRGDFRADFDLHDYPFDRQTPLLRLVNAKAPRQQVAYVTDVFGLRLGQTGETADSVSAFRDLQLWRVLGVTRFVDYFANRSTLGKPVFFDSDTRTRVRRIRYRGAAAARRVGVHGQDIDAVVPAGRGGVCHSVLPAQPEQGANDNPGHRHPDQRGADDCDQQPVAADRLHGVGRIRVLCVLRPVPDGNGCGFLQERMRLGGMSVPPHGPMSQCACSTSWWHSSRWENLSVGTA